MLKVNLNPGAFPRVCNHYGELTVNRRKKADEVRAGVRLSRLFTTSEQAPDDDVIMEIEKYGNPNIEFKQWSSGEELEQLLLETMAKEIGMEDPDDQDGFDLSLGGAKTDLGIYFNVGFEKFAEKWQILALVRNMPQGVMNMNRLIHLMYRENFLKISKNWGAYKRIANSLGAEGVVYGDKVINVINTSKKLGYPEEGARNYIANGKIGIACGDNSKSHSSWKGHKNDMKVEFSSQLGISYSFDKSDFNEENGTAQLELAYDLTVHKAQESQFNTVILVIAEPVSFCLEKCFIQR